LEIDQVITVTTINVVITRPGKDGIVAATADQNVVKTRTC
jgi:hypothetical protein